MNEHERWDAIFSYEEFDRLPIWYFGTWEETRDQWLEQGLSDVSRVPEETGMDPEWEQGMWDMHGLVNNKPISDRKQEVIEETDDHCIVRTSLGAVIKQRKGGSSIPHHIEEAMKPTRESWEQFKTYLDPTDQSRYAGDWEAKAEELNGRNRLTCFLGGSLFGWPREWLGPEQILMLSYDDPVLFEEIIDHIADFFMTLYEPILEKVTFDFAYFFEDCCCRTGPLFSPDCFEEYYAKYYKKMTEFYRRMGVKWILLDSDGKVDIMIPHWLDAGIDIMFPIEVGAWKADPVELRKQFGKDLRMFGGVNKHVIPEGEEAIRTHLEHLKPLVQEGGFIPIPDHRIPPSCSLDEFRTYVEVFKDVFGG
ncbi:uroporphyrinogen decarboxylase family protein [Planctomycetota bacterium]